MASIRKDVLINAGADEIWAALRDVGKVDRLFRGVLTAAKLEGDVRFVTFANGLVVRERIVDIDDLNRRVVHAVIDGAPMHHSASMQVFAQSDGSSRFVWISDFLPDDLRITFEPLIEQGAAAVKIILRCSHLGNENACPNRATAPEFFGDPPLD